MSLLGSIGLSSLPGVSTALSIADSLWSADKNSDELTASREFNRDEAAVNRDFQQNMRATQYQTAVKDMQAAGLNPMLAYSQGGAGNLSGAMASSSAGQVAHPGNTAANMVAAYQSASQVKLNDALEDRTRAEAAEVRERTQTYQPNIQATLQGVEESKKRIEELTSRIGQQAASAANLEAQTTLINATLPKVKAEINHLRSMANLNEQQIKESITRSGLTFSQTMEIQQKIKQNLPEIERRLRNVEEASRLLALPRQGQEAKAHSTFLGELGALGRALTGIPTFIPYGR